MLEKEVEEEVKEKWKLRNADFFVPSCRTADQI